MTVAWHGSTVKILVDLTYLVDQMLPLMEQFEQVQDHDRAICLRYTSIISLTTIAEIHNVLSNTTPDSRIKRLDSLQTLAQLTEEIPWSLRYLMDQYICVSGIICKKRWLSVESSPLGNRSAGIGRSRWSIHSQRLNSVTYHRRFLWR